MDVATVNRAGSMHGRYHRVGMDARTVDVLVAWTLSSLLYPLYHTLAVLYASCRRSHVQVFDMAVPWAQTTHIGESLM